MNIISTNNPKANKEHTCQWCGGKIEKGEVYEVTTIENEGSVYDWRNHTRCEKVYQELKMYDHEGDGVDGDEFSCRVSEYLNELDTEDQVKMICASSELEQSQETLKAIEWAYEVNAPLAHDESSGWVILIIGQPTKLMDWYKLEVKNE